MYAGFISNGDRYRVQGATLLLFATNFSGKLASLDRNSSSMKENSLPIVGFEPTTHSVRVECYNHLVNRTLTEIGGITATEIGKMAKYFIFNYFILFY